MQEKRQDMKCDSPIAVSERILEEERFTSPKLAPKNKQEEKQIVAFEQAPKKNLEKKEGQFDDPELTLKKSRVNNEGKVNDSKLSLKKTREKREQQFDDPKQTKNKTNQKVDKLEALNQAQKKKMIRSVTKSPSQLFKKLEKSQSSKQIINDQKTINKTYLYCHQKNMKEFRMKAKIMIRQRRKAQKREEVLQNQPQGQAIKQKNIQLESQMSQQSQDIILTEEQEKEFQEIQNSFQTMRKKLQPQNVSLLQIKSNIPRYMKGMRVRLIDMKRITVEATVCMMIYHVLKSQIQKELTQADRIAYAKVLESLDKDYEEIDQGIDKYFPGEKENIYKKLFTKNVYQIYRKNKQEKMSLKQNQASVHIQMQ